MSGQVVITGVGIVSAVGLGREEFQGALWTGASGLQPGRTDPTDPDSKLRPAFEICDFEPRTWLGKKGLRVLDRSARLLSVAALMALQDAGLLEEEGPVSSDDLGLVCGTMFGSVHSIASFDWSGILDSPKYVNPMQFPNTVINSPAGQAAIRHRLRGLNATVSAGLASGLHALQYAADSLRFGRATALLAGGVEELCQESYLGFAKDGLLSRKGEVLPFSPDRDGTVPGEGAALCSLELEDTARTRGATPLAEIAGFGTFLETASNPATAAHARGATLAIEEALAQAQVQPDEIGLIVAGANGSRVGDKIEERALKRVFGPGLDRIPACAPKASCGEMLGASGALQAVVAVLALSCGEAPPTLGAGGDLPIRLAGQTMPLQGDTALVTSFGCYGNHVAMVIGKPGTSKQA